MLGWGGTDAELAEAPDVGLLMGGTLVVKSVPRPFEVVGLPATMRRAFDALARCGVAVVVGMGPMTAEVSIPVIPLAWEDRALTGSL